jgi:hypothetical protein
LGFGNYYFGSSSQSLRRDLVSRICEEILLAAYRA